jgi:hypothetical protein
MRRLMKVETKPLENEYAARAANAEPPSSSGHFWLSP